MSNVFCIFCREACVEAACAAGIAKFPDARPGQCCQRQKQAPVDVVRAKVASAVQDPWRPWRIIPSSTRSGKQPLGLGSTAVPGKYGRSLGVWHAKCYGSCEEMYSGTTNALCFVAHGTHGFLESGAAASEYVEPGSHRDRKGASSFRAWDS